MKRFESLEFDAPDPQQPQSGPPDADQDHDEHYWMKRADAERREGQFENALRYYSRSLELNKTLVDGWLGQAQMLIALGEYTEAELWARKALELFKNRSDLIAARAQATVRLGKKGEALTLSDGALKQEGQSPYRWMVRGEIMVARGQDVEAHCFDKSVQLDGDWLNYLEIAQIYRHYRKFAKAVTRIRQAIERAPDRAHCWYVQGCCELDMNMYAAAKKSFHQCIDLKPGHLDARNQLIRLDAERFSLKTRLKNLFRMK